jgi:hypothetical protein
LIIIFLSLSQAQLLQQLILTVIVLQAFAFVSVFQVGWFVGADE